MRNSPALLLNATPVVSRFFGEMSKKHQQCAVVNLNNNYSILQTFTVTIVYNNYSRISAKMGFSIEDKALITN
jgi:hypothetical protein